MNFFSRLSSFFSRHFWGFLFLFFLCAGGYLLITEFWYFGTVHFFLSEKGTTIRLEKNGEIFCQTDQCSKNVIPGIYQFSVEKENFKPFFGKVEVKMQKISEEKILLLQESVQIASGNYSHLKKEKILDFSVNENEKSILISPENFSRNNTSLFWKKSFLGDFPETVKISSDEIGRGYWVVTAESVRQFDPTTENFSLQLQQKISQFLPLSDGSFVFQNFNNDFFWKPFLGKVQKLEFPPFSLSAICKSGSEFIFLEEVFDEIYLSKWEISLKKKSKKIGKIENFEKENFHSMQCFGEKTIVLFFKEGNELVLEY